MADLRVRPEEEEEAAKEGNEISDMKSASETRTVMKKATEKLGAKSIWDCGSPLYDSHELVSVTHVIERHWMIFPYQVAASSKNSSSSSHHGSVRKSWTSSSKNTVMNKIMMKTTTRSKIIDATEATIRNKNKDTTRSGFARFFCCGFWMN